MVIISLWCFKSQFKITEKNNSPKCPQSRDVSIITSFVEYIVLLLLISIHLQCNRYSTILTIGLYFNLNNVIPKGALFNIKIKYRLNNNNFMKDFQ